MNATTSSKEATNIIKDRCDICWRGDGFQDMKLLQCTKCLVSFHGLCYGFNCLPKDGGIPFQCWACFAIGKTIRGRHYYYSTTTARDDAPKKKEKELIALQVTERPTECCLCGVDNQQDFLHAMHPIYDNPGLFGRQIILSPKEDKPLRLAWGHTLCCMVISAHQVAAGIVYGCLRDGSYGADDSEEEEEEEEVDDDDDDDDDSVNSQLRVAPIGKNTKDDDDDEEDNIHHFVYITKKRLKNDELYFRNLKNLQSLVCYLCKQDDSNTTTASTTTTAATTKQKNTTPSSENQHIIPISYRIPIQCCFNEPYEHKSLKITNATISSKKKNKDTTTQEEEDTGFVNNGEKCVISMHVGCALWHVSPPKQPPTTTTTTTTLSSSWPQARQIYFFPGTSTSEPVVNAFCYKHSMYHVKYKVGTKKLFYPGGPYPVRNTIETEQMEIRQKLEEEKKKRKHLQHEERNRILDLEDSDDDSVSQKNDDDTNVERNTKKQRLLGIQKIIQKGIQKSSSHPKKTTTTIKKKSRLKKFKK